MWHLHHHVRINAHLRVDLEWWKEFLGIFNGKMCFVASEPVPTKELSTDTYPGLVNLHINLQETFTVLIALECWKE